MFVHLPFATPFTKSIEYMTKVVMSSKESKYRCAEGRTPRTPLRRLRRP
jgi:hypothetical protein